MSLLTSSVKHSHTPTCVSLNVAVLHLPDSLVGFVVTCQLFYSAVCYFLDRHTVYVDISYRCVSADRYKKIGSCVFGSVTL